MLCLNKKTEYALVALAHLAELPGLTASAREIAVARRLPLPLLMNILKSMQHHGLLKSTRGVKGGYKLLSDLAELSLQGLIAMISCQGAASTHDCGCMDEAADGAAAEWSAASAAPVQALQYKFAKFLQDIRVADLVLPGRRIDVPIERLKSFTNRDQVTPKDHRSTYADFAV